MKRIFFTLLSAVLVVGLNGQCEFIDMSVSSSSETQLQLFTPTPFFIPNADSNSHFWDITDNNGNVVAQETTGADENLVLFEHNVPLTDTIIACLSITNEVAGPGITCTVCDSLAWGGSIIGWEIINEQTGGTFEATQPPIPNYLLAGQSAPCPPRVINFQNFTFGSDSISWSFPGGDPASSTENNQLVTYNAPGDYSFSLEVFNSAGSNSFTSTDEITVYPNPIADFSFTTNNLSVNFENLSEADLGPGQNIDYLWTFGDGTASIGESPTHVYETEGTYEVNLSTTNLCGTSENSYTVTVTTTGVEETTGISAFSISPNPSSGQFDLKLESQINGIVQLRITDLLGQAAFISEELVSSGEFKTIKLGLEHLNSGVYFLTAQIGSEIRSEKLIIE